MFYESHNWCGREDEGRLIWDLSPGWDWSSWCRAMPAVRAAAEQPGVELLIVQGDWQADLWTNPSQRTASDEVDPATLWHEGLQALQCFAQIPVPTLAVVTNGRVQGWAWEWLQRFDRRVAVATVDGWIRRPRHPAWVRGQQPAPAEGFSCRRGVSLGDLDDVFTVRRANVEIGRHAQALQGRPQRDRQATWSPRHAWPLRAEFLAHPLDDYAEPLPRPGYYEGPPQVGLIDPGPAGLTLALEAWLRGVQLVMLDLDTREQLLARLQEVVRQGRLSPYEAELARARLEVDAALTRGMTEARWLLTRKPTAVEFLRPRLHPWVHISLEGHADPTTRAYAQQLGVDWPGAGSEEVAGGPTRSNIAS